MSIGFYETQPAYMADPQSLVGQFRRLGDAGPAYEIMAVHSDGRVDIEVVYSDEKVTEKLESVLNDPIAESLP